MQIGDRVVNKVTGRNGEIVSVFIPVRFYGTGIVHAKIKRDDGNFEIEKVSNLVIEQDYIPPQDVDIFGENLEAQNVDELTPRTITKEVSGGVTSTPLTSAHAIPDAEKTGTENKEISGGGLIESLTEVDAKPKKRGRKPKVEDDGISIDELVENTVL